VGYSFDKHRTQSRAGNLFVYAGLGFFKGMTPTKTIPELVSSMKELKSTEPGKLELLHLNNSKQQDNIIFGSQIGSQIMEVP